MSPRGKSLLTIQRRWRWVYIGWDATTASLAYLILYSFRKTAIEPALFGIDHMIWSNKLYIGIFATTFLWLASLWLVGMYNNPLRKSRLKEMGRIVQVGIVFVLGYFLAFLLDDYVGSTLDYFHIGGRFAAAILLLSLGGRIFIASLIRRQIRNKRFAFPTLLIGTRDFIEPKIQDIKRHGQASGEVFVGWVNVLDDGDYAALDGIPMVSSIDGVSESFLSLDVEDCIVALPENMHGSLSSLILVLEQLESRIFMFPDTYGILSGQVQMDDHGLPLVEWHLNPMTAFQAHTKRLVDVTISTLALIVCAPLYLLLALCVKWSSKGGALYRQERLGLQSKPFFIIKFRSMLQDAEGLKPLLSKDDDPRITSVGKVMRKYRLDELPQFWNILVGDMSLVGPRPERRYFAQQILQRAPQYQHIYKVRPGLTSWGMVRFGYASQVDEMIKRMEYDLIYIENITFFNDLKVVIYTIWTILKGRGL